MKEFDTTISKRWRCKDAYSKLGGSVCNKCGDKAIPTRDRCRTCGQWFFSVDSEGRRSAQPVLIQIELSVLQSGS